MKEQTEQDLARLAARIDGLAAQLAQLLPVPAAPDWDAAVAFRWRRRRTAFGTHGGPGLLVVAFQEYEAPR